MKLAAFVLAMMVPSIAHAETNVFKCVLEETNRRGLLSIGDEAIVGVSSVQISMITGLGYGDVADNCDDIGKQTICKTSKGNITFSYDKSDSRVYFIEVLPLTEEKYMRTWACQPFKLRNIYREQY